MYTLLFVFVAFILGLYMCLNYKSNDFKEGLENNHKGGKKRCPDVLIQKGSKYHLLNTSLGKVPGVNPVVFDNLEDYVEFLNWQKSQNIICPILFLQRSYNAQGKEEYKIRPSPFDKQGGLGSDPQGGLPKKHHLKMPDGNDLPKKPLPSRTPASSRQSPPMLPDQKARELEDTHLLTDANRNDPPYNAGGYPGFDPMGMNNGVKTPLDKMFNAQEKQECSDNPTDANWCGPDYSRQQVASGLYEDNNVKIWVS